MPQFLQSLPSPVEGVPVIPDGSRLWGHLLLMREPDFRVALDNFSVQHADAQGRCTFYMGPATPALSVTAALDVQLLLKSSVERNIFPLMQPHLDRFFGARNIGLLQGKQWKRQRAVVVQALHGKAFQQHNREAVRQATEIFIQQLFLLQEQDKTTDEININIDDMGRILRSLTIDIFGQSALHTDFGCCRDQLQPSRVMQAFDFMASDMMRRLGKDILNPASHLYSLPTAANRRHAKERAYLRNFIADLVQQRRQLIMREKSSSSATTNVPQDLLTGLLEATRDQEEDDTTLSDMLVSLLFAGYETTSVAMTYTLYMLSQHPAVEEICLREIRQKAAASSDDNIETSDDFDLPYLRAVITETLRLYPPAISTTRSLERETTLPGDDGSNDVVVVPKGTYLYFPIWTIHRDSRNFEHPLEFRPERWVVRQPNQQDSVKDKSERWCERDDDEAVRARSAFVAFSAGARSCAGQRFALQEMSIVLAMLLKRFRYEMLNDDYVLTPHRDGFVQSPEGGVPMKAIPRK